MKNLSDINVVKAYCPVTDFNFQKRWDKTF